MSDPFQKIEEKYTVSKNYLQTLQERNYPTVISTRSDLIARDDYFSILKSFENVVVQFSFSTLDDKKSMRIEPNSPKPSKLLRTMEKLSKAGVKTAARWQPVIVGFSETPEMFISKISSTGIKHLGVEHLKIPLSGSSKNAPWPTHVESLGMNLNEIYKSKGALPVARELILPAEEKIGTILNIKKRLNRLDITFGCADNEFQYLSDTQCCCSGIDQFQGFDNWYKFQIGYAIRESINKKTIRFSAIKKEWRPTGSIKEFINSHCRTENENSIYEHLSKRWNSNDPRMNLASFYNVSDTNRVDSSGYKIYKWND
ncbi:hypothetical protein K7P01_26625 [Fulvivirgaceae bacterium QH1ED-6-2]|nr:hypothetical protein [Parachryseolinea silvisoli]MCD9019145.1 hypothetical protein [Parachryseolinea silvisoli]